MTAQASTGEVSDTLGVAASRARRGLRRRPTRRTVPAAVLAGSELVHLGGGENIPCPGVESIPMAPYARRLGLGSSSLALPPAKVHVLHGAVVCPRSRVVVDRRGRVVAESLTADMLGVVGPDADEIRHAPLEVDGTVALFRSPWRPYYHTLVDHLPRAALLGQPAIRRLGPVTVLHDGALSDVEERLLRALLPSRCRLEQIPAGRSVLAERVLLPGYVTRPAAGAIPSWYRRWLDREASAVRPPAGSGLGRRIFVDRRGGARSVLNRGELDDVLERHGIQAIDPAALGADAQIALFRDAELVVGVTGSGLANLLFSKRAALIELAAGQELLPHYFYMTASKGLGYAYVLARPDRSRQSATERLARPVQVDTDALDRLLTERFSLD